MSARQMIEPAAVRPELERERGEGLVWESEAVTSIAISLRRIADALEKANEPVLLSMSNMEVTQ